MFSKFKAFRKAEKNAPVDGVGPESGLGISASDVQELASETSQPVAKKPPSEETRERIRNEVAQIRKFFSDRAQFGIGMACNSMKEPAGLRSFVDFNQYDVNSENPSFWKLQTQSGLMFGQLNDDGAFVYPAQVNKNAPFEDSKLGRGLASFGGQFQPEVAQSKPLLTPVGSVSHDALDRALTFCKTHKAAVAIALLARKLPEPAQCEFVSVRRMREMDNGAMGISLGLRLRCKSGIIKPYRLLMDAKKAVLIERADTVVLSISSEVIQAATTECEID